LAKFKALCPDVPVTYYSKGTGPDYWDLLKPLPIDAIGIDWHHDISQVLDRYGERWAIQGNVDPQWLFMDCASLDTKLREVFSSVLKLPAVKRRGWICGLGHGVLPKTPEENVRHFIKLQREVFE
jgi:uroporphyrinogen decarboxylase